MKTTKAQDSDNALHIVEIRGSVCAPEEGLLIGNGDLSVSIYQKADRIVWRFGKNDVWDRRHDCTDDPAPAHIREIANGIRNEGWVNESFGKGKVKSHSTPKNEKRMMEICSGAPSYAFRPYPCPKPVGELSIRLPFDYQGENLVQRLTIEKGIVNITCSWQAGLELDIECYIPPEVNALAVNWRLKNAEKSQRIGRGFISFSLYRWADPDRLEFARKWIADYGNGQFMRGADPKATPLPVPVVEMYGAAPGILQKFYPDLTSAEGFSCVMLPIAGGCRIDEVNKEWSGEARVDIEPDTAAQYGTILVFTVSGNEPQKVREESEEFLSSATGNAERRAGEWRDRTLAAASEFWSRSAVRLDDELLERIWYETLHARRCTFRNDVIAPGLFLPSTVNDYSYWHGDYHSNYNYQEPFWGDYTANQISIGDSYFPGMEHIIELGRKLARDYWNTRGTFIQLTGYPFKLEDDPYGVGSLCRMAYMTGWAVNQYWFRYLYTMDTDWLREKGYPAIRDAALFYTDFLTKFDDGLFHAFPSGEGEYHYTGDPKDYTDKPQVIRHARYCLQAAAKAATDLDTDDDLCAIWRDILDNLVEVDDLDALGLDEEQKRRYFINPPEFTGFEGRKGFRTSGPPEFLRKDEENAVWSSYFGHLPWIWMGELRCGSFDGDRDYPAIRDFLERWRLPNGLFRAMCLEMYGYAGAWSESLGILAPLQEMLLQSWHGSIEVFPNWPKSVNAAFKTLRAEGAFLVTSELTDGSVSFISIHSEKGRPCRVINPWDGAARVRYIQGGSGPLQIEEKDGVISFDTSEGIDYEMRPKPDG